MNASIGWLPSSNHWKIASARLRCFLPCKYLKEAGAPVEIFNDKHIDQYKVVVFQKRYEPASLELAKQLRSKKVKVVFDLCDNHFYNPAHLPELTERAKRLQNMIEQADVVSVSTPEIEKLISGKRTVVIDDAIDEMKEKPWAKLYTKLIHSFPRQNEVYRIVWYGNTGTQPVPVGLVDLVKVMPSLEALHQETPLSLSVISNSKSLFNQSIGKTCFPVKYYEWKAATFPYLFKQHDVCIIPVTINPFTLCKTNNRPLLSLLLGIPVVADRIPSYEEFEEFVLFADWKRNLQAYASNLDLRRQHVRLATSYIQGKYTKQRVISQWTSLFQTLIN